MSGATVTPWMIRRLDAPLEMSLKMFHFWLNLIGFVLRENFALKLFHDFKLIFCFQRQNMAVYLMLSTCFRHCKFSNNLPAKSGEIQRLCFGFVSLLAGNFLRKNLKHETRGRIMIRWITGSCIEKQYSVCLTWTANIVKRNQFSQGFYDVMMFCLHNNRNFTPETDNLCQTTLRDHLSRGYEIWKEPLWSANYFSLDFVQHSKKTQFSQPQVRNEIFFSTPNCLLLLQFMIFSWYFPYRCIP